MFFSIVIPSYNRATKIPGAIRSILAQSFKDFEIIVIDDGSSDNTEAVVQSFNRANIHYLKTDNFGVAHARNQGILKAKGQYVGFLDSDDLFEPEHLQTAYDFIQAKHEPEVVHLNFAWGNADKKQSQKNKLPQNLPDDLFKRCSMHVNCLFIRNDIAKKHLFNEARALVSAEDWDLFIKLAIRYPIHLLDKCTAFLVDHDDRSTKKIDNDKWFKVKDTLMESLSSDPIIREKYSHQINIVDAHMRSLIALNLVLQKNKIRGFKLWLQAIRLNPAEIFTKRSGAIVKHIFTK